MRTSDPNPRMALVSGTTCTTLGVASRMRWAVTTTAGCRKPAFRPAGTPRSNSTTSPEISIKPIRLGAGERSLQLQTDPVLAQTPHRQRNRLPYCRAELRSEALQLLVGSLIDPNTGALHTNQDTN